MPLYLGAQLVLLAVLAFADGKRRGFSEAGWREKGGGSVGLHRAGFRV